MAVPAMPGAGFVVIETEDHAPLAFLRSGGESERRDVAPPSIAAVRHLVSIVPLVVLAQSGIPGMTTDSTLGDEKRSLN
jgi:hypothetical protein